MALALGSSATLCGTPLQGRHASRQVSARCAAVTEAASSKEKKGETLAKLSTYLQPGGQTAFIAGVNFKGFTVSKEPPRCHPQPLRAVDFHRSSLVSRQLAAAARWRACPTGSGLPSGARSLR
jgi:hypothetical protein